MRARSLGRERLGAWYGSAGALGPRQPYVERMAFRALRNSADIWRSPTRSANQGKSSTSGGFNSLARRNSAIPHLDDNVARGPEDRELDARLDTVRPRRRSGTEADGMACRVTCEAWFLS